MKYTVDTKNKKITIINAKGEDIIKLAEDYKDYTFQEVVEKINLVGCNCNNQYNPYPVTTLDKTNLNQSKLG